MFKRTLLSALALVTLSAAVARAEPKDDVQSAIKKLADIGNYSWTNTTDSQFVIGPTEGKTEKDGYTTYTLSQFQTTNQVVAKGDKVVVKLDDGWKTAAEIAKSAADASAGEVAVAVDLPPEAFLNMSVQALQTPTAQAKEMADRVKEIKKTDAVYSADLTPDLAKDILLNRRPGAAAASAPAAPGAAPAFGPTDVSDPKGSVKFTIKDGQLAKFEVHVSGGLSFGGNDIAIDRTNTTEFKDVGTTKVTVPDDAKAKLTAVAAPAKP